MEWLTTQRKLKCLNKNAYSATDNKQFYVSYLKHIPVFMAHDRK